MMSSSKGRRSKPSSILKSNQIMSASDLENISILLVLTLAVSTILLLIFPVLKML